MNIINDMAKCILDKVNLESMRSAIFPTNLHAGWLTRDCHLLLLCHDSKLSSLLRWQISIIRLALDKKIALPIQ